jgi:hypothetical protein
MVGRSIPLQKVLAAILCLRYTPVIMQKPSSIDLTTGLMAIIILIELVHAFTMAVPAIPPNMPPNPMLTPSLMASIAHGGAILGAIIAAICVFFYWKGQEWARWLVMIDSVLVLLGLIMISRTMAVSHMSGTLQIAKAILAVYLLWNLNTAPVKAWFKSPKGATA